MPRAYQRRIGLPWSGFGANEVPSRILIASPDRYGRFGHQTTSIYAAVALAHLTGSLLLHPRYMFFADRWNEHVDWSRSRFVTRRVMGDRQIVYLEQEKPDRNGNRKWRLSDGGLKKIVREITSISEDSIIHLPFDQSAGDLMSLATRTDVREDLNNVFGTSTWHKKRNPYACIHIRRGDCTPDNHQQWYVPDGFYVKLIQRLNEVLPKGMPIVICTQGPMNALEEKIPNLITEGRVKIQTTSELWTNDAEVNDFITLSKADILITARSTFSRWAGLIGPQKCVVDVNRQSITNQGEQMVIHPDENEEVWGPNLQKLASQHIRERVH